MADLPTGTITFLFSDIEGSTALLRNLGERYDEVLGIHRQLLREAFEEYGGHEVGTEGDSFFVVFEQATAALAAAVKGQRLLQTYEWAPGSQVRVRMGLHTGEARLAGGDYVGLAVHLASRISAVAHGGQILVSSGTRELVEENVFEGVTFKDLGEYRLKDLEKPERLLQVCHPDLLMEFPPLRSSASRRHNLPVQLTSFIGRENELSEVKRLANSTRLVTITGAGGSGKTRLALQVAADLLDESPDGVWVVDLAAVADPELVIAEVATSLGLREQEGRPLEETLNDFIAEKKLLLLLDNCEHLVDPCGRVADRFLRTSPGSRILVTTREALGVAGEVGWRLPSLSLPDPERTDSLDGASSSEAVRLFLDRASLADPSFSLAPFDVPFLIQICRRLDGIPLAIELAAARVKVLSLKQIAERLDDRFRLLTGGSRSALPRQQTLRALVDWSYGLLSEPERSVLMRASVFAGGLSLEAAETVCSSQDVPEAEVLEHLTGLVNKSLIVVEPGAEMARYRFLETIRQYAREKLLETPWVEESRSRHLDFFLWLAQRAEPRLQASDQKAWLDLLEAEHDNLRAALDGALPRRRATRG